MFKMKKIVSLVLLCTMMVLTSSNAFASNLSTSMPSNLGIEIYSEAFSNAYIETDVLDLSTADIFLEGGEISTRSNNDEITGFITYANNSDSLKFDIQEHLNNGEQLFASITSTVFVKESYAVRDGVDTLQESRLLSRHEIPEALLSGHDFIGDDEDTYHKLTLRLNIFTGADGTSERYVLSGNAFWTLGGTGEQIPASGDDYIGFTWGGEFDFKDDGIIVTENNSAIQLSSRMIDSVPNSGIVWGFEERKNHWNEGIIYAEQTTVGATLTKNRLTGSGNTTSVMLKYIHTYESAKGSINIGGSTTGPSGGFVLTGVDDQWPLAVKVTGLPY